MIEGGWAYVYAAYAVALGGLAALTLIFVLRAIRWAREAKKLEERP
jgi:hypothetical protein